MVNGINLLDLRYKETHIFMPSPNASDKCFLAKFNSIEQLWFKLDIVNLLKFIK